MFILPEMSPIGYQQMRSNGPLQRPLVHRADWRNCEHRSRLSGRTLAGLSWRSIGREMSARSLLALLCRDLGCEGTSHRQRHDFAELERNVVAPWLAGRPFTVSGTIVRSADAVTKIKIVHTTEPQQLHAERHNAEMRASGIADMATDRRAYAAVRRVQLRRSP
jgi:hypothetical protein